MSILLRMPVNLGGSRIRGLIVTDWYDGFMAEGKNPNMWSIWFIYFMEERMLYNLYPNLPGNKVLAANWNEEGVHPVQLAKASRRSDPLLDTWDASCEKMPAELVRLDWDGRVQEPRLSVRVRGFPHGQSMSELYD